jgi:methyl-accepting chemotaxis protein
MQRKIKLGTRLVLGMTLILVLMTIVGASGYFGLTRMLEMTHFYSRVNQLQQTVSSLKENTDQYLLATYRGQTNLRETAISKTLSLLDEGHANVLVTKKNLMIDADNENSLDRFAEGLEIYKESFKKFVQIEQAITTLTGGINKTYDQIDKEIKKSDLWTEKMVEAGSVLSGSITAYFAENSENNWSVIGDARVKFKKSVEDYAELVKTSDELRPIADNVKAFYNALDKDLNEYHELSISQQRQTTLMNQNKISLNDVCTHLGKISAEKLQKQTGFSLKLIMTSLVVALIIGILFALFSVKMIIGSMKRVITHVAEGAEHTLSIAGQVSDAGRSLASGSSEQAASIQETSSSLEEMTAGTKQNAKNALQADEFMKSANQLVEKANGVMASLTNSMNAISKSSEDTHNIVIKIDEIAFQTNLLALNAAVEAARAGDAGSGFAVVADEVRTLAMRAAGAAKDTAQLIESTVKQIKEGSSLVAETHEAFGKVAESVTKVGDLIGEIADASEKQARGIEQVSHAVLEMDRVTRQNAANAEQSAGASEELNAQAKQMRSTVDELASLIGDTDTYEAGGGTSSFPTVEDETQADKPFQKQDEEEAFMTARTEGKIEPEQLMPLSEPDLKDH